jgi:4-diphosphocytidyl-2-C-methyl-D-erythritol kinase
MVVFPNAKINLGLNILRKRLDGFHEIASCMYPIGWADALEIVPAEQFSFESSGIAIPGDTASNLCVKAYQLLRADFELPPVAIHLHKVVPIGAGLGGGSADAAFTLKALSELFGLGLSVAELQRYANLLGSDCAFFIENTPQYCTGRGECCETLPLSLSGKWILLVNPGLHIATAEAYAGVQPQQPEKELRTLLSAPLSTWRKTVSNDFEASLFPSYPLLNQLKEELYHRGATYASMSGSGSTLFGIFEKEPESENISTDFIVWKGKLS